MLYAFDLDGTIITSYMSNPDKNYFQYEILPGRVEILNNLLEEGHDVCFITNQAGVAFGYQRAEDTINKVFRVLFELFGLEKYAFSFEPAADCTIEYNNTRKTDDRRVIKVYIAFGHAEAKLQVWGTRQEVERRKPSPAMLMQSMAFYDTKEVVFVGDMATDRIAADCAGVEFITPDEFFMIGDEV